jgi:pyridoxal phosphate enzyme (YggS family)
VEVSPALEELRDRIRQAGADPSRVRVVAVTKTFGPVAVRAALAAGLTDVGENYLDELSATRAATSDLEPAPRWHYLGALQSNKVARVVQVADVVSSVSRVKEIDRLVHLGARAEIDIQVDYTGRPERGGAHPDDVSDLVARARDGGLRLRGLMTVAPPEPAGAQRAFGALAELASRLDLRELSMGMSDDLEWAVAAGSTELRVGRALFGPRAPRPGAALT